MYMNEQLFRNPVISEPDAPSRRHVRRRKLMRTAGLLAAVLIILVFSLCASLLGGDQDVLAASNGGAPAKRTVEIVKGDTLWGIANAHVRKGRNVREYMDELKKLNRLDSSVLHEGQVLQLP
ncbi:LysM peptidoglycan-binding domain-containing protein [Paenibacillus doosanensis]|uniref:LysM peptidoglycan-binding domain-containing protein n=1 Tax=Paenibacillus doosanensis TaxID=1229154 RepID=UPI00217F2FBE|nr:LysM peptidoglycan-binding domain-containing protein [Paenibacillus doosanensis]MCS7461160.1 LysM peptidoglycan-binding domain-containing protein [Paenibacillus doosanensis]